jgi:hypothetical protein
MNSNQAHSETSALPRESPAPSEARFFRWSLVAAGAAAALLIGALIGGNAGAKDPVQVAIRPDATAVIAAAAVGADEKPAAGTGTFKGVVTFKGKPPKRELEFSKGDTVKVKDDDRAICAAEDFFKDDLLVNEKDGGVANVVIYLRKAPEGYKAPPVPDEPAVFDQKGCRFTPHVMVIRCKQKLLIKSGDSLAHNTHITPFKNDGFNKAISPDERKGLEYVYQKPENQPIPVVCDIHKWMKAHHLPLDHPLAAVTDEHGKFEIKGLPPGTHKFFVWHESPGYLNRELSVEITADKVTEEKLSFTAAQFKVGN